MVHRRGWENVVWMLTCLIGLAIAAGPRWEATPAASLLGAVAIAVSVAAIPWVFLQRN